MNFIRGEGGVYNYQSYGRCSVNSEAQIIASDFSYAKCMTMKKSQESFRWDIDV